MTKVSDRLVAVVGFSRILRAYVVDERDLQDADLSAIYASAILKVGSDIDAGTVEFSVPDVAHGSDADGFWIDFLLDLTGSQNIGKYVSEVQVTTTEPATYVTRRFYTDLTK